MRRRRRSENGSASWPSSTVPIATPRRTSASIPTRSASASHPTAAVSAFPDPGGHGSGMTFTMKQPAAAVRAVRAFARYAVRLPRFLAQPIGREESLARLRRGLEERAESFLYVLEHAV